MKRSESPLQSTAENPEDLFQPKIKHFDKADEYPEDLKLEGLRPNDYYAGGAEDEIIEVGNKRYRKEPVDIIHVGREKKRHLVTEVEYFSHSVPEINYMSGSGWYQWQGYQEKLNAADKGWYPREVVSDLPLFRLVEIKDEVEYK